MKKSKSINVSSQAKDAFDKLEKSSKHIFLTGRAGTGKSTLLKYFRENTKKKIVVLAPTGVAALNVHGQTIHSFFGFNPEIKPELVRRADEEKIALFKNIDAIVIDEISMVRADLLDCIDKALRLNRKSEEVFGGVQMIFIGDLFQLPPVLTKEEEIYFRLQYGSPFFFSAHAMQGLNYEVIELKKVHRQQDIDFVEMLNRVRVGEVTDDDIEEWNRLYDPTFEEYDDQMIHLTTTNKMAEERNRFELKKLKGKILKFKAEAVGEFGDRRMPSEASLELKVGARVMFTNNDAVRRWVNGSLGTVVEVSNDDNPILTVALDDGEEVEVKRYTWEVFKYAMGEEGRLEEQVVGSYTQYPLTLAWAVTIHKAQGKTFDNVLIDLGWGAFAHGQLYVALSRARKFANIVLVKPFRKKDVIISDEVLRFVKSSE
jgi:ATP-dependent DNA helicase PIF1